MTCLQCGSAHQRGRFCNRCGSKHPRTPGHDRAIRRLYDTALAREAAVGERPLERYLSVLLATPGPT